jgi:acetyl-CoA acetyltransferase
MTAANRERITTIEEVACASAEALEASGLTPNDIEVLQIYDSFTPMVVMALEDMGFCAKGEGYQFVQDGNIEIGGTLPINTHGGNLGEGYCLFMNHVREGVRQIRGTSLNQVPDCEVSMLMAGYGYTTSALLLGR